MKFTLCLAVLSAIYGVEAATGVTTTITAPGSVSAASTPDVVTRSDVPVTPCTSPPFTAVTTPVASGTPGPGGNGGSGGGSGGSGGSGGAGGNGGNGGGATPTAVPVNGAGRQAAGGVGAAVIAAGALFYLL